jgi:hypothetical protein
VRGSRVLALNRFQHSAHGKFCAPAPAEVSRMMFRDSGARKDVLQGVNARVGSNTSRMTASATFSVREAGIRVRVTGRTRAESNKPPGDADDSQP